MKILLADDHAVVRRGMKDILAQEFKRAVFGEAKNAQEALDLVWKQPWDVVVLDITMPGRSGLEVLREIKRRMPETRLAAEPDLVEQRIQQNRHTRLTETIANLWPRDFYPAIRNEIAGLLEAYWGHP